MSPKAEYKLPAFKRSQAVVSHWRDTAEIMGFEKFIPFLMTYFYTEEFHTQRPDEVRRQIDALLRVPRTLNGFLHTTSAVLTHDVVDRLAEIRRPALLLCGEEDVITPPRHTVEMASRMRNARFNVIPRSAHGLWSERPEVFETVMSFLGSAESH